MKLYLSIISAKKNYVAVRSSFYMISRTIVANTIYNGEFLFGQLLILEIANHCCPLKIAKRSLK